MIELIFKLLIGHALCDYPLQGDFIGKFKSYQVPSPIPGVIIWWHLLTSHCLIHAGAVWVVTGNAWLAFFEFVVHWMIDFLKCMGVTNFHADQVLHLICKIAWAFLKVTYG